MPRILVKAAPGLSATNLTFDAARVSFQVEPLFRSIRPQGALGAAADDVWYILHSPDETAGQNAWDICHALMQPGFGVAGHPAPSFAEPDIEQRWITGNASEGGQSLAQSCDRQDPQNHDYPVNGDSYWFRDLSHSQFDAAARRRCDCGTSQGLECISPGAGCCHRKRSRRPAAAARAVWQCGSQSPAPACQESAPADPGGPTLARLRL
jgi:hypothetical protein